MIARWRRRRERPPDLVDVLGEQILEERVAGVAGDAFGRGTSG